MIEEVFPLDEVSGARKKRLSLYALVDAFREERQVEKILISLWGKPVVDAVWKNLEKNREEKREWLIDDREKESIQRAQTIFFKHCNLA